MRLRKLLGSDSSESSEFEYKSLNRKRLPGDGESDSSDSYVGYAKLLRLRERNKPKDPTAHLEKVGRHVKLPRDFERLHGSVVTRIRVYVDRGIITPTELCDPLMLNRLSAMPERDAQAIVEQFLAVDLTKVKNKASALSRILRKYVDEQQTRERAADRASRRVAQADRAAAIAAAGAAASALPPAAAAVFDAAATALADARGDGDARAPLDEDLPDYDEE